MTPKTFPRCGHPKTKENSFHPHGKHPWVSCRTCKNELQRRNYTKRTGRLRESSPPPSTVSYIVPRGKRYADLMAEAKRDYAKALEREQEARKGGRPKGAVSVGRGRPNQFPDVRRDPANALLDALGNYGAA
jgi:hypothetical protein